LRKHLKVNQTVGFVEQDAAL